jgi:hypothetical protein
MAISYKDLKKKYIESKNGKKSHKSKDLVSNLVLATHRG